MKIGTSQSNSTTPKRRPTTFNGNLNQILDFQGPRYALLAASGSIDVTFPISGSDSGLVQRTWAMEQQKGAAERGAIQSQRDRTSAA